MGLSLMEDPDHKGRIWVTALALSQGLPPYLTMGLQGEFIPKALCSWQVSIMLPTLSSTSGSLSPPRGSAGTASARVCGLFTLSARLDSLDRIEACPRGEDERLP